MKIKIHISQKHLKIVIPFPQMTNIELWHLIKHLVAATISSWFNYISFINFKLYKMNVPPKLSSTIQNSYFSILLSCSEIHYSIDIDIDIDIGVEIPDVVMGQVELDHQHKIEECRRVNYV